jgi:hypothetical protein
MPLPVLLGPAAYPAAAAAAKTALAVGAEVLPTISSASLAAVLARMAWNRVPDWIREDVTFRGQSLPDEVDKQETESLSSVLERLEALMATVSKKLECPVPNLYAAILAYVQLCAQLKQIDPVTRDDMYSDSGKPFDHNTDDFVTIKHALDFATWAYYLDNETYLRDELEGVGFKLVQARVARRPGSVGHFVAVSHEKRTVVIGVKGTSSLEDLLTDCCGQPVLYNLGGEEVTDRVEVRGKIDDEVHTLLDASVEVVSGHEIISILQGYDEDLDARCHEGILISTKLLYEQVLPIVDDLIILGGYRLELTGHSLGGGAASLLGVLLRSRIPKLDNLHVYAFAPPPVLDYDAATGASKYVTSIVNNSDLIPRWSLTNLTVFLEFLRVVSDKLQEHGLRPTGPLATAAFIHKLSLGTSGDMLMTSDEVREAMKAAQDMVKLRHPDHLYVPGRVLLMHKHWQDEVVSTGQEYTVTPVADLKQYCIVTDGTAKVLRSVEIDGHRMLSDHTTAMYYASIESLISRDKQEEECPKS